MGRRNWVLGAVLLGLLGCAHKQTRAQSEDEADKAPAYAVQIIGDTCTYANADPAPLGGYGLVGGLEGTGGGVPPGPLRTKLEEELRKGNKQENVKELLASPDVAAVVVSATVPPGARMGDRLDIEVALPPGSKCTSLRGGYLRECYLYNYDTAKNLMPDYSKPDRLLLGHKMAKAEGALLVGLGDGDEASRLRQARIWGGGKFLTERCFYLILDPKYEKSLMAQAVAERINETVHGGFRGPLGDLAAAKTTTVIHLRVPTQYRLNMARFLRVVRLMPLGETRATRGEYVKQLEQELKEPARAVTAALRLEALGTELIPVLKTGLDSDHVLVRFCAAEALAYLGSPASGEELRRLVEEQPALRAYCLTALASLNEAVSYVQLRDLLYAASPETRYGAFRALRALDEREPAVAGELLNESFWLHRVAPQSAPLVHLTSTKRAEVVLFGEEPTLLAPFSFLSGEFTITAKQGDEHCTVSRISLHHGAHRRQCPLKLEDVLRTLAGMGGTFADALEVLRQAHRCESVSCPVAVDALPQATSVYELAQAGRGAGRPSGEAVARAAADLGSTPTLFETAARSRARSPLGDDEEILLRGKKSSAEKETAQRRGKANN